MPPGQHCCKQSRIERSHDRRRRQEHAQGQGSPHRRRRASAPRARRAGRSRRRDRHERARAADGHQPLVGLPPARDARRRRVRGVNSVGPLSAWCARPAARQQGARRPRPACARPSGPRGSSPRRPGRRPRCRSPADAMPSRSTSRAARRRCRASRSSAARASPTRPRRARCCSRSATCSPCRAALTRYTERTIADRRDARARGASGVASLGWAAAVARARARPRRRRGARVRAHGGELAAIIGVQGPASRFDGAARQRAVVALMRVSADLSARLGWSEPG